MTNITTYKIQGALKVINRPGLYLSVSHEQIKDLKGQRFLCIPRWPFRFELYNAEKGRKPEDVSVPVDTYTPHFECDELIGVNVK